MKLNIGCGDKKIEGYTSVDIDPAATPDIVAAANKIPLADGVAEEIMSIHMIEHALPWDVPVIFTEWYRLMRRGELLVLEQPDFMKSCRNVAEALVGRGHKDQLGLWGVYGDPRTKNPWMLHRWGYWFESLRPLVEAAGFSYCVEKETRYHRAGKAGQRF